MKPKRDSSLGMVLEADAPGQPANLRVTIMIATKNRVDELRRTCSVLRGLDPQPLEIIITADGCTDGTVEFVRAELPQARLIVHEQTQGSVASRDKMIREAQGELVLSLDDDSYPEQHDCLARIVPLFEQRPQMAVLHFPQRSDEYPASLACLDFGAPRLTRSYSSSGAVLRRSTYLCLGDYDPAFFHAYEEPDYALKCVAGGQEIVLNPSVTIRHHYSRVTRSELRTHHRHARNEFWSTLVNVPFPYVLLVAVYRVLSQFRYACSRGLGWIVREPVWWLQALAGIPRCLRARRPVRWVDYRSWLRLPDVGNATCDSKARPAPDVQESIL